MKQKLLYFILIILSINACKKFDPAWDSEILTPLLKTKIGMKDLIRDSSLVSNEKHELKLVSQKKLYDLSVDSIFEFSDTGVYRTFKIEVLSLYSSTFNYPISLGQICRNAGLVGLLIASQNGKQVAIPAVPAISSPAIDINADTLFTDMTLASGSMDVSLKNEFPIDITEVSFELRNASNNDLIVFGIFPLIPAGQTITQTFSLAGKTMEGKLKGQLLNLTSPGSNGVPVLIDTTDNIVASLKVYDLHPSKATAVFPAQDLVNASSKFIVRSLDVMLKDSRINSGKIRFVLYSTLQDSVYFTYRLPSATLNGLQFETSKTLPPAPIGGVSSYDQVIDIKGYKLNLSGEKGDTINTAFNQFKASIKYTGEKRTLSLTDSFYIRIDFFDIHPEYAVGYLGNQTFNFGPATQEFDLLKNINGEIKLDNARLSVQSENFIGVDATMKIENLDGLNSNTNKKIILDGSALQEPLQIHRATDNNGNMPIIPNYSQIVFDKSNSNINEFIGNLPDALHYSLTLETNPKGNTSNYNDFIYDGHLLNLRFNLEVPLHFNGKNIQLMDTLEVDFSSIQADQVESMELYIIADNGFPFDANLELTTLDNNDQIIDKILTNIDIIKAAKISTNDKVDGKERTVITIPLDKLRLNQLLVTKKMLAKMILNTKSDDTLIKIFDDYNIDLVLSGKIKYKAE